ncbi:MAG: hypothetical protein CSA58_02035 [Micrococcales bacterium]|nr:MAG: hypothetical protein CSA58_02035 [Micrococcales bacterium]
MITHVEGRDAPTGDQAGVRRPQQGFARKTALDMARTMAVIVACGFAIFALVPRPDGPAERVIDIAGVLGQAESDSGYSLAAPEVPASWRPTSARYDAGARAVHIGYLTEDGEYVTVAYTDAPHPSWVHRTTWDGRPEVQEGKPVVLQHDGRDWESWVTADSARRSLVRNDARSVLVVGGTATRHDLWELADAVPEWQ